MKVVDMFSSIQGDGSTIGETASFLQLAGCNIIPPCSYCDQSVLLAPGTEISVSEVAGNLHLKNIVVTGGEPLLQVDELLELLPLLPDRRVTIETNGTIYDERIINWPSLWSISPRLGSSGHHPNKDVLIQFLAAVTPSRLQFKLVIQDESDLGRAWHLVEDMELWTNTVILQPSEMVPDFVGAYCKLVTSVLKEREGFWSLLNRLRILPRLSTLAWHHTRKQGDG